MRRGTLRTLSVLLAGLSALVACAPPAIKTTMLVPAMYHEAAKLKEVAVLPFDGPGGSQFAAEIEGMLAGICIEDKQYFNLIDRNQLHKVLEEMKLPQVGLVDPAHAAQVGKLVGAKAIYSGIVTASHCRDSHYQEWRSECVEREIKYDKKGKPREGRCLRWKKYAVPCTKREATFAFAPKLIEVETGRVIYASSIQRGASSSACSDSEKPLSNELQLIEEAKRSAMDQFRRDIAPHYVEVAIKMMDSTEGFDSKEAKEKFRQGLDFAQNGRLDRACELWEEAKVLAPNSPSILYNIGICAEAAGELEQALELYKKADRLLGKPDDRVTAALHRVSSAIQKKGKLREQISK